MILHRLHLDKRCKEVRRDLADPYQMHATLSRAFSVKEEKCPPGTFLWRLEPEAGPGGSVRLLVQSQILPQWERITYRNWLAREPEPPKDLEKALKLNHLSKGMRFRFRLRANPSATVAGKRRGLLKEPDQAAWLIRQGIGTEEHPSGHGFTLPLVERFDPFVLEEDEQPDVWQVSITQTQMLRGYKTDGQEITIFSALFEGQLEVVEPDRFRRALRYGIGHGKALGLGLLSVVPLP